MSTIVLVHGIAQEQYAADTLESAWLPALAGGVRNHGRPDLADRLWRTTTPGDITVRMAYYGHYFLAPDSQGAPDPEQLDDTEIGIAEQLAAAWLATAAATAHDARDRVEAAHHLAELDQLTHPRDDAQGARAALRPAINGLTRLRWFAPFGMGLAGRFVSQALSQVTRYLSDDTIRAGAQDLVLDQIGPDTRLVIGHSLGSVVAYEALHRSNHSAALLTLGSPLGLRTVIYDRLLPHPPHVPPAVTKWDNLVDRDDLVAAHLDLQPYFPPAPGQTVVPITPPRWTTGPNPTMPPITSPKPQRAASSPKHSQHPRANRRRREPPGMPGHGSAYETRVDRTADREAAGTSPLSDSGNDSALWASPPDAGATPR